MIVFTGARDHSSQDERHGDALRVFEAWYKHSIFVICALWEAVENNLLFLMRLVASCRVDGDLMARPEANRTY
jgi:hypothetical protein